MAQCAGIEWNPNIIDVISNESGIERKLVKAAVNSRFFGGRLSERSSIMENLSIVEQSKLLLLHFNATFNGIKQTIKNIRKKTGLDRDFSVYFRKEREVIEVIEQYIRSKGGRVFTIHDGGYCDIELNKAELEEYVYSNTGLRLHIEIGKNI